MLEKNVSNDICKETIMVLSFCEDSFIDKIPDYLLSKLNEFAADSDKDYFIDSTKSLNEQSLSNECKDLLSDLYFSYVLNDVSRKEVLKEVLNYVNDLE